MSAPNGTLTAKFLLPFFIVTRATRGILRGFVSLPSHGAPAMIMEEGCIAIGENSVLGLPIII